MSIQFFKWGSASAFSNMQHSWMLYCPLYTGMACPQCECSDFQHSFYTIVNHIAFVHSEWAFVFQTVCLRWCETTLVAFVLTFLHCVFTNVISNCSPERIYIYSQSLHFVWIFSAVYFQSSNDLRINYHIGYICQTFLTWENFCTTSALSPEMRPLPSVSIHVHLQVVSTRKRFTHIAHSSHSEGL